MGHSRADCEVWSHCSCDGVADPAHGCGNQDNKRRRRGGTSSALIAHLEKCQFAVQNPASGEKRSDGPLSLLVMRCITNVERIVRLEAQGCSDRQVQE